jgi:hypothetical protein
MIPDFYCMLSGVPAAGPPSIFPSDEETPLVVDHLARLLAKTRQPNIPSRKELRSILTEALSLTDEIHMLEYDTQRWCNLAVVFGPCQRDGPNPTYFRLCSSPSCYTKSFTKLWDPETSSWIDKSTDLRAYDDDSTPPCTFMDSRCWYYIQSWFDVFPPGSDQDSGEASFAKALWDAIQYRFGLFWPPESLLEDLDYGPIRLTFRA